MQMPDFRAWLWHLIRHPLLFGLLLLAGVAFGFAYSYGPVHRAKNWKIEHLGQRLLEENERIRALEQKLGAKLPSPSNEADTVLLDKQLADLRSSLAAAEKRASRADEKAKKSAAEAKNWKTQHTKASRRLEAAKDKEKTLAAKLDHAEQALLAAPEPAAPAPVAPKAPSTSEDRSEADAAATLASGLSLQPGTGWQSANGKLRIDVLSVGNDSVEIAGSWQKSGDPPELLRAGKQVTQQSDGTTYRVEITSIEPFAAATIHATTSPTE